MARRLAFSEAFEIVGPSISNQPKTRPRRRFVSSLAHSECFAASAPLIFFLGPVGWELHHVFYSLALNQTVADDVGKAEKSRCSPARQSEHSFDALIPAFLGETDRQAIICYRKRLLACKLLQEQQRTAVGT